MSEYRRVLRECKKMIEELEEATDKELSVASPDLQRARNLLKDASESVNAIQVRRREFRRIVGREEDAMELNEYERMMGL